LSTYGFKGNKRKSPGGEHMALGTRIIHTGTHDPWWNLALEEYLLNAVNPFQCILYLWQNQNTIVIGRHQNPWRECRCDLFESEGGKLARRLSGGGAVYHDLGNLNFTFVASRQVYDLSRQTEVILDAVRSLGIDAEKSGRNDLTADGRKFSGNAFCFRKNSAFHHGTVLVSADFGKLAKYLQVSKEKMESKGVKSVQSRVVNLSELVPGLTVDDVASALISSFRKAYGSDAPVETEITADDFDMKTIEELYRKYSSWEWRYGEAPQFDLRMENRFPWGGVEICFRLEGGRIKKAYVFSDAMDEEYIGMLPGLFEGCQLSLRKLGEKLRQTASGGREQMAEDLARWLEEKEL